MMKKISIIIPVYNVESYLKRCLDSIIAQSYRDFEVLLIDDGSNDSSPQICDEYALKDERIHVIHKENGGVSSARNAGLNLANGQYIAFVDSDDYIEADYLESLLKPFTEQSIQLSVCGYFFHSEICAPKCMTLEGNSMHYLLFNCVEYPYIEGYLWNKLYLSSIIRENHLQFNEKYRMCEDTLFNFEYFQYVKNAYVVNEPLYHYIVRENSAMKKKPESNELAMKELIDYFIGCTEDTRTLNALIGWAFKYWIRIIDISYYHNDISEYRNVRVLIKKYRKSLLKNNDLTRVEKLFVLLLNYCPYIYTLYKSRKMKSSK